MSKTTFKVVASSHVEALFLVKADTVVQAGDIIQEMFDKQQFASESRPIPEIALVEVSRSVYELDQVSRAGGMFEDNFDKEKHNETISLYQDL